MARGFGFKSWGWGFRAQDVGFPACIGVVLLQFVVHLLSGSLRVQVPNK